MCAKLLNTIIESIYAKGDTAEASRIAKSMFFSLLEKLSAIVDAHDRLKAIKDRKDKEENKEEDKTEDKAESKDRTGEDVNMEDPPVMKKEVSDKELFGWRDIEQAMPVHSVAFANESFEYFCKGSFLVVHGIRC